jgi:hypothetical protein
MFAILDYAVMIRGEEITGKVTVNPEWCDPSFDHEYGTETLPSYVEDFEVMIIEVDDKEEMFKHATWKEIEQAILDSEDVKRDVANYDYSE